MTTSTPQLGFSPREFESVEVVTPRTYYTYRSVAFWVAAVFAVLFFTKMGFVQLFKTEMYLSHFRMGIDISDPDLQLRTQIRGMVMLTFVLAWIVFFLRRSAFARYVVCLAVVLLGFSLVVDVVEFAMSEEKLSLVLSSGHFLIRPFILFSLLIVAFSLAETVRFERKALPPGTVQHERRQS